MKMKKTYINPETAVVEVELQQMIAATNANFNVKTDETVGAGVFADGKENEISSGSIWGEEE